MKMFVLFTIMTAICCSASVSSFVEHNARPRNSQRSYTCSDSARDLTDDPQEAAEQQSPRVYACTKDDNDVISCCESATLYITPGIETMIAVEVSWDSIGLNLHDSVGHMIQFHGCFLHRGEHKISQTLTVSVYTLRFPLFAALEHGGTIAAHLTTANFGETKPNGAIPLRNTGCKDMTVVFAPVKSVPLEPIPTTNRGTSI